jgi:hypothetical protein
MLTLIETISLAGDRNKQNDDACGFSGRRAWVLDGATDIHDAPLTGWKSDASWIAHFANVRLHAADAGARMREIIRTASADAAHAFAAMSKGAPYEKWQSPISSLLMIEETSAGLRGVDLGDSRIFALGDDGAIQVAGGVSGARDAEADAAAKQTDADKPLLQRTATIDMLRRGRASLNKPGAHWTFGIDPTCADHARSWSFDLTRPAHVLLMTDGFAVLADQYDAYDPAGLVRAAVEKGLQELGREVRAIEAADAGGAKHPRFKSNDDATAMLLRLT